MASRSPTPVSRPLVLALLVSLGFASASQAGGTATERAANDAEALRVSAAELLGDKRVACVGVRTTSAGSTISLVLISRSAQTLRLARRAISRAGARDVARIEFASARYGRAAVLRILRYLQSRNPEPSLIGFDLTDQSNPDSCGRVVVRVASAAAETSREWARAAQRHFGADRVTLFFVPPGEATPT